MAEMRRTFPLSACLGQPAKFAVGSPVDGEVWYMLCYECLEQYQTAVQCGIETMVVLSLLPGDQQCNCSNGASDTFGCCSSTHPQQGARDWFQAQAEEFWEAYQAYAAQLRKDPPGSNQPDPPNGSTNQTKDSAQ